MHNKDQTARAGWRVIPSNVLYQVQAVLLAEVKKTSSHSNNNKAPGFDNLNIELVKGMDEADMFAQLTDFNPCQQNSVRHCPPQHDELL